MTILDVRELISFGGGDNATDTVIGNIHFNLTTLEYWNYTLYDNGTLSNGSRCLLTQPPYTPSLLFDNGTFINATTCYSPTNAIGSRAKASIGLATIFGFMLVFCLICLSKHGRLYLPTEKRFRPIGRRWQWYWAILTCVAALISLFMNIDVDRYYLPELPIVLTSFFWYLLELCAMAIVWEATRHWGSWKERQFIDPNPFALPQDDRRARFELLIPLVFYLFWWLNFFLVVPHSWSGVEKQRSPEQIQHIAVPTATDSRFKAAAFMLLVSWCVTVISLHHSIRHYVPRAGGAFQRATSLLVNAPPRLIVLLFLSLAMIAYQALCAFKFQWSVLNVYGDRLPIFLGGYVPALLIVIVQVLYGWISPNEDRELARQRRLRGAELDRELGLARKPAWWRNSNNGGNESMRDRIARNVLEIGGGRATTQKFGSVLEERARNAEAEAMEMGALSNALRSSSTAPSVGSTATARTGTYVPYEGRSEQRRTERTIAAAAAMLFPNAAPEPVPDRRAELMMEGPPPPYRDGEPEPSRGRTRTTGGDRPSAGARSSSTGTLASIGGPAQQVRSMLDL